MVISKTVASALPSLCKVSLRWCIAGSLLDIVHVAAVIAPTYLFIIVTVATTSLWPPSPPSILRKKPAKKTPYATSEARLSWASCGQGYAFKRSQLGRHGRFSFLS